MALLKQQQKHQTFGANKSQRSKVQARVLEVKPLTKVTGLGADSFVDCGWGKASRWKPFRLLHLSGVPTPPAEVHPLERGDKEEKMWWKFNQLLQVLQGSSWVPTFFGKTRNPELILKRNLPRFSNIEKIIHPTPAGTKTLEHVLQ